MNRTNATNVASMTGRMPECRGGQDARERHATTEELTAEESAVLRAIRDTSYGAVEVVIHQQRIVQLVKTEKLRLESHPASP